MAFTIKKGDTVKILTGRDKGKKGKILRVFPEENRVVVEALQLMAHYTRPSQQNPKGGMIRVEGKIHRSNVQLVCPKCAQASRVGFQFLSDRTKQRMCKKCHEII